jgi:hypothetical protein
VHDTVRRDFVNPPRDQDCVFKNTWGTPPSSGVDIEPDVATEKVKGIVFRRCRFENNYGDGVEIFLANQKRTSDDLSILFEDCHVTSQWGSGMRVTKVLDDGPGGLIEFRNCVVQDTEGYGIKVQDKAADRARVRFVNCTLRNVAKDRAYRGNWTPIWLQPSDPNKIQKFGGLDFVACVVEDSRDRPAIEASQEQRKGLVDITGSIYVHSSQFSCREEQPGPERTGRYAEGRTSATCTIQGCCPPACRGLS